MQTISTTQSQSLQGRQFCRPVVKEIWPPRTWEAAAVVAQNVGVAHRCAPVTRMGDSR